MTDRPVTRGIDPAQIKFTQVLVMAASLATIATLQAWPALVMAALLGLGLLHPGLHLPALIFRVVIRPLLGLDRRGGDDPRPHRFAQGLGTIFLGAAGGLALLGAPVAAAALAAMVGTLAALNVFAGFCLGCQLYFIWRRAARPG